MCAVNYRVGMLVLKASLGSQTRRIPLEDSPTGFTDLMNIIQSRFDNPSANLRLVYHDGEEV